MNMPSSVNVERQAARVLEGLLREIPALELGHIEREATSNSDHRFDILAEASCGGKPLRIVVEVKRNGQPRVMRDAARQLQHYVANQNFRSVPIVMAPYLSEQAREACKDEGVGYVDFQGNAHIAFDTIYIDRQVAGRPEPERRALRSLFKPKSARLLRCLLREPGRHWRVAELADAAKVSIGLASTVGSSLRERSWVEQTGQGMVLTEPDDLLDTWANEYEPPKGEEVRLYTHLHGDALLARLRALHQKSGRAVLSSFSAAEWLAPYVRQSMSHFYADDEGMALLERELDLKPASKGANIVILVPDEDGVLDDAVSVADELLATSPVQTYLDLLQSGERGREGAEHLRATLLKWVS